MTDLEVEISRQKTGGRSLVHVAATLTIRKEILTTWLCVPALKKRAKMIKSNTKGLNKSICK